MAGKPRITIDFNKIYQSNSCGPFKIIEDIGRDERSRYYVKIKFLQTGSESIVRYDTAIAGKVRDELMDIDFNKIYYSVSYGPFKIISYLGRDKESKKLVRIKFLRTGFEIDTHLKLVLTGQVKDYSTNEKILIAPYEYYDSLIIRIIKTRWQGMMQRCYNKNSSSYNIYGAIGVTVCEYWHNFENYLLSMPSIPYFFKFYNNPHNYALDKDYLQQNIPKEKRIYSPETCIFLSYIDNSNLSAIHDKENTGLYGIREKENGNYSVAFSIDGIKYSFGTYSNLNAAITEYDYYYNLFGLFDKIPLYNNVPITMTHEQAQQYLVSR